MIDLLFLDTYHVSSAEDLRDWYIVSKDFVLPTLAIFFSIKAVYWGIKRQNDIQFKNKEKEQVEEREILKDIILENNPLLIDAIDNSINALHKNVNALDLANVSNFTITTISNVHFKIVRGFGYLRIFETINRHDDDQSKAFSKYWVAVDSFEKNYDRLTSYLEMAHEKFYKHNSNLNDLTHLIAIETSDNIHTILPPFTTTQFPEESLETDPALRFAIRSHEITNEFNISHAPQLVKLKWFLQQLFDLKNDKSISKILKSDYVQKLERGLAILNSMESILKSAKASVEHYISIFEKNKTAIENFHNILGTKMKYSLPAKKTLWEKIRNWLMY
ncbi:hypothetical protein [Sphingobacterium multivorum]|uniref:hypothetical protein n=1 Tax=Sphingobacterium multivorum TaxID=28454 RepID=UPI0031BA586C